MSSELSALNKLICPKCSAFRTAEDRFCSCCGVDFTVVAADGNKDPLLGVLIGDKFVLRELIGSGGMGKVYRAEQKGVGRTIAVKIMHRHLLGDQTAAARFTNEARAASTLNHPHSIAVVDFGQTDNGTLYMVMEYLRGRSLADLLQREFPLALGRVAYILCQVAEAVAAAHELAIIHRDLKPENIFLLDHPSGNDFVKVLDFGIAKMLDAEARGVTTPGLVPGTPEYMSPEQARGEPLDARSDVYALGVVLYELVTGRVPFREPSAIATMMAHVQEPPLPPSQRRKDLEIPAALESIILWALTKRKEERMGSARQFRELLSAWAKTAQIWPRGDASAGGLDVLLEFFSQAEVNEFREQVDSERHLARVALPVSQTAGVTAIRFPDEICGREQELSQLCQFAADGSLPFRALRVIGDRGVGKQRLCLEFARRAEEKEWNVLMFPAQPGWIASPLGIVQEMIARLLGIPPEDTMSQETLLTTARRKGLAHEDVAVLEELFGFPSLLGELEYDVRARDRYGCLRKLVADAAEQKRLLLFFIDCDLYDSASRRLISEIVNTTIDNVVMVVSYSDTNGLTDLASVSSLHLTGIDFDSARRMVEFPLTGTADPNVIQEFAQRSAGHPLFLEQLVYAFAFEGLLWPPDKPADLIAARIERLEQEERTVLQWLAVWGRPADARSLGLLRKTKVADKILTQLVTKGFLRHINDTFEFAHRMIAMVVHSTIPAEVRRDRHKRAVQILRQQGAPVLMVAHHAYEADDGSAGIESLIQAGDWAQRCGDEDAAIRNYTRGLELVRREWGRGRVAASDLDRWAVAAARQLGEIFHQRGENSVAQGTLEEMLSVAAGKPSDRAMLRLELGMINVARGDLRVAERHLRLALADLDLVGGHRPLRGQLLLELARVKALLGEDIHSKGLILDAMKEPSGPRKPDEGEAFAPWDKALLASEISVRLGEESQAFRQLQDALVAADEGASTSGKIQAHDAVATYHISRDEWNEAETALRELLAVLQRVGSRALIAETKIRLGQVARMQRAYEQAAQWLSDALATSEGVGWMEGLEQIQRELSLLPRDTPSTK